MVPSVLRQFQKHSNTFFFFFFTFKRTREWPYPRGIETSLKAADMGTSNDTAPHEEHCLRSKENLSKRTPTATSCREYLWDITELGHGFLQHITVPNCKLQKCAFLCVNLLLLWNGHMLPIPIKGLSFVAVSATAAWKAEAAVDIPLCDFFSHHLLTDFWFKP